MKKTCLFLACMSIAFPAFSNVCVDNIKDQVVGSVLSLADCNLNDTDMKTVGEFLAVHSEIDKLKRFILLSK